RLPERRDQCDERHHGGHADHSKLTRLPCTRRVPLGHAVPVSRFSAGAAAVRAFEPEAGCYGPLAKGDPVASLQFWFELASTYSYPAAMRVEARAAEKGVAIEWRPFLLGPIFQAQGWNDSPFNVYPAKGRYMWRDLERVCAKEGLGFTRPSRFPRGS